MSETDSQSFERTKLKKQLTQRKRGKEPAAAIQDEEKKSAVSAANSTKTSSAGSSKGIIARKWKEYAPSYLQQRPTAKIAFDVAFFAASVLVVAKLGKHMNNMIADLVPTEASLR